MLRRLFACFALLTGLAAAGAPAHAIAAKPDIARIEAGVSQIATAEAELTTATSLSRAAIRYVVRQVLAWRSLERNGLAPSVRIGIDRARE